MWLRNPLDDVLSSRAKIAVLRILATSRVPLSGREVGRRAHIDAGHTSRVLRELVASGILLSRDMGRVAAYELDRTDSPLVRRVKELFATEADRYHEVVEQIASSVPGLVSLALFGSEARRQARPGSDTDILIVVEQKGEQAEELVREACFEAGGRHAVALSWHVADLSDLQRWDEEANPLWRNLLTDGVLLRGRSLEELRRQW